MPRRTDRIKKKTHSSNSSNDAEKASTSYPYYSCALNVYRVGEVRYVGSAGKTYPRKITRVPAPLPKRTNGSPTVIGPASQTSCNSQDWTALSRTPISLRESPPNSLTAHVNAVQQIVDSKPCHCTDSAGMAAVGCVAEGYKKGLTRRSRAPRKKMLTTGVWLS